MITYQDIAECINIRRKRCATDTSALVVQLVAEDLARLFHEVNEYFDSAGFLEDCGFVVR